uniref:Uncharacterized protein LOC114344312 n=1 Tax=Diabrotica virgifera virgifera TaxID=50390 RepID=A0A6P7GM18_DIAVI
MICGIKPELKPRYIEIEGQMVIQLTMLSQDVDIVPVYLRPGEKWERDFFNLERVVIVDITEQRGGESIVMTGDVNGRIGEGSSLDIGIEECEYVGVLEPVRTSIKDKIANAQGRRIIGLCEENDMVILNGRTPGDHKGEFTFVGTMGSSVIDLACISRALVQRLGISQ